MTNVKTHKHRADDTYSTTPFAGCVALPGRCRPATHGKTTYILRCTCGATKRVNDNAKIREHGPWMERVRSEV